MNICLISREYPLDTAWGGIGTYTYNLANGLAAAGQNIHVICQSLDVDREYIDNGIYVHKISHKSVFPFKGRLREFGLRWEYSQSAYNKLREVIDKYNIDIVEAPNLSGEGFIYSFHKKTPLVTRLHTHYSEVVNFLGWNKSLDRSLSCWFENIAVLRSDLIICSTKAHAESASREIGLNSKKIKIIPLGVSIPEISEERQKNSSPVVLFVGRLEKRKGIHILIKAIPYILKEVPNTTFFIIGRDSFIKDEEVSFFGSKEHSYKEQLVKMLPAKCKDKVQFLGYVSSEELDRYYRMCDLFVAPSLYESFGFIYIEAMSYAKPVIGCSVGGIPEVIKDGETGILVPPVDIQMLADAVIGLLKDTNRARKIGNLARTYVKEHFSRDIMVRNTIDAYLEIYNQKKYKDI